MYGPTFVLMFIPKGVVHLFGADNKSAILLKQKMEYAVGIIGLRYLVHDSFQVTADHMTGLFHAAEKGFGQIHYLERIVISSVMAQNCCGFIIHG